MWHRCVIKVKHVFDDVHQFLFCIEYVCMNSGLIKCEKAWCENNNLHNTLDGNVIKCEKTYEMCEGCGQKIHDRYLMRVADASWHEHCLSCSICGCLLTHSCYTRNTKLYCKADYDRYVVHYSHLASNAAAVFIRVVPRSSRRFADRAVSFFRRSPKTVDDSLK
ncbi:hypothetical protein NQ318_019317 [Aromia moschata]|uniref:LIM zinc-binding domain-containing protein n=1 Tax=Aromia moschata TaxID=1265417 RepID=A0AAV8YA67_9CUCU|nr:hypothetical protein NQ318_019317 [Aromia moschata]